MKAGRLSLSVITREFAQRASERVARTSDVSPGQAKEFLKQAMFSSTRKSTSQCRLSFIRECISKNLIVNCVERQVNKLQLSESQKERTKSNVMKSIRKDVYREVREKDEIMHRLLRKVSNLLNERDWNLFNGLRWKEVRRNHFIQRQKYKEKIDWLTTKKTTAQLEKAKSEMNSKINSDLVDINFEDIELPKEFESAPRVYGGISLENNEKTFLELSPKFALYGKLDEIRFRSDVEKSFTKLRWQSELSNETNNKDDGDNISKMEAFYDDSKKTFDLSRVPATKVPFNKRIYMPTYANGVC